MSIKCMSLLRHLAISQHYFRSTWPGEEPISRRRCSYSRCGYNKADSIRTRVIEVQDGMSWPRCHRRCWHPIKLCDAAVCRSAFPHPGSSWLDHDDWSFRLTRIHIMRSTMPFRRQIDRKLSSASIPSGTGWSDVWPSRDGPAAEIIYSFWTLSDN